MTDIVGRLMSMGKIGPELAIQLMGMIVDAVGTEIRNAAHRNGLVFFWSALRTIVRRIFREIRAHKLSGIMAATRKDDQPYRVGPPHQSAIRQLA